MNKQKSILKILFFLSITFLYSQDKDFEKSISNTEKQIRELQRAISQNNNEISINKSSSNLIENIHYASTDNLGNKFIIKSNILGHGGVLGMLRDGMASFPQCFSLSSFMVTPSVMIVIHFS